jgi:hypothetical protein
MFTPNPRAGCRTVHASFHSEPNTATPVAGSTGVVPARFCLTVAMRADDLEIAHISTNDGRLRRASRSGSNALTTSAEAVLSLFERVLKQL